MAKAKVEKRITAPLGPIPAGHERFVRIRADKEGFRRAGVKHTKAAVDHPIDKFDDKQMDALLNEPKLNVQIVDLPAKETEAKA